MTKERLNGFALVINKGDLKYVDMVKDILDILPSFIKKCPLEECKF